MKDDTGEEMDQELLDSFLEESFEVVGRLKEYLACFKGASENTYFEKFGQEIDRIMGAAYTLSLTQVGDLAKFGKELGYKAGQIDDLNKLFVIQSLLSQLLKNLEIILKEFKRGRRVELHEAPDLLKKMSAASHELGNLRASVKM